MNIRKHWKRLLLTSTAIFWANCGGDSEDPIYVTSDPNNATSTNPTINPDDLDGIKTDTLYGIRPVYNADSGAVSSSDACESSSSSETESSSSFDPSMPYRLASDPTVRCAWKHHVGATYDCLDGRDHQYTVERIKKELAENQTRTLEQLDSLEDETKEVFDEYNEPLYGVRSYSCTHVDLGYSVFECSDGQTYPNDFYQDETYFLYTEEEYRAKYPEKFQTSSSSEPEPESSSSAPPPSPLCQKNDFATDTDLKEAFKKDMDALLDSTKKANEDSLSEQDSSCLERVHVSTSYSNVEVLAKKQICDGDTIVNPRYQERLDKHKEFIRRQINNCLKDEN